MRRLENKKGRAFLLFACPNVVSQGVGVIAQLVWVRMKIMPCSYACDVLSSDLQGVQGYASSGTLFRCPFQIRGSEAFLTTFPLHSSPASLQPPHSLYCPPTFFFKVRIFLPKILLDS